MADTEMERGVRQREIAEVLRGYPAAPRHWAGVFSRLGFSARVVSAYMESSAVVTGSPLRANVDCASEEVLQNLQGMYGVGGGGDKALARGEPVVVRYLLAPHEQEAVMSEVSGYALPRFQPAVRSSCSGHLVARAIRRINMLYLGRMLPRGTTMLEVGVDLQTLPFRSIEPGKYMAAAPRLGPRDAARRPSAAFLRRIADPASGHSEQQRSLAQLMLEDPQQLYVEKKVQEVDFRADCIVSNDATHDIPFGDLPRIMARAGARVWVGAMMRAKGLSRHTGRCVLRIPVVDGVCRVDPERDQINFHFSRDPSFDYTHCLSEHLKYEERMDFTFRGTGCDYVYTKLPATTDTTLFFCVFRVPAAVFRQPEPVYAASGYAGKVRVRSVRAVDGPTPGVPVRFEPYEFFAEEEGLERVLEKRLALGRLGNYASTIAFMRSARVRFYLNGVPVGSGSTASEACLESTAVAIEAFAGQVRRSAELSLRRVLQSRAQRGFFETLLMQVVDLRRVAGVACDTIARPWAMARECLAHHVRSELSDFVVSIEKMESFLRVEQPFDTGVVVNDDAEGCVCAQRRELQGIVFSAAYSVEERAAARAFLSHLEDVHCGECGTALDVLQRCGMDIETDEFFDAKTDQDEVDTATVESSGLSVFTESQDASVSSPHTSVVGAEAYPGDTAAAMQEYAGLQAFLSRAVESETRRVAGLLFSDGGVPSVEKLGRWNTTRARHYVVRTRDGEIVSVDGAEGVPELARVFDLRRDALVRVEKHGGRQFVVGSGELLFYASSVLEVFNYDALHAAVEALFAEHRCWALPRGAVFVQGVPGCGKTYEIKKRMKKMIAAGQEPLYLAATRGSRGAAADVYGDAERQRKKVRTLDSYMIRAETAHAVFVDEAPMAHFGQVCAALAMAQAEEVYFYGDTSQIPFISFTSEFQTPMAAMPATVRREVRNVTHRCKLDVCAMWYDEYPDGFFPCECHEHQDGEASVGFFPIVSMSEVPYFSDVRYLVFTQKEREDLRAVLGLEAKVEVLRARRPGGLATVHEDQGETHERVFLVRGVAKFDPKEGPLAPSIYNSRPHCLTATTRHRREFRYYSVSPEVDTVRKRLAIAGDVAVQQRVLRERATKAIFSW